MILHQIVAHSKNFVIGDKNKLLWHYKEDLQFFKKITSHKIVIVGRKTYESIIQMTGKPLPDRFHIVISRTPSSSQHESVFFSSAIQLAYEKCQSLIDEKRWPNDVYIIGGTDIYQQTLTDCQKLYVTVIKQFYNGDASYPHNYSDFFKLEHDVQSELNTEISFQTWIRR